MRSGEEAETSPEGEGAAVEYGSVWALYQVAKRIGLEEALDEAAPKRDGIPVGKLVLILAISRCVDPLAKWRIPEWYQRTYLPELLGVDLPLSSGYQTLTRCLGYLTEGVQMEVETALSQRVVERYGLKGKTRLFDMTSTFVVGEGAADILQYGYSRDGRPDALQVNYGLCVTSEPTVPMFHVAHPGNTPDSRTVDDAVARLQDRLGLDGCVVIDRGMVTASNVREIVDERGLDLVGGLRMDPRFRRIAVRTPLDAYEARFEIKKEALRAKEFRLKVGGKERRCLLYYSGDKASRDEKAREKRLAKAEAGLGEIQEALKRTGPGRRPTRSGLRRRIETLLEKTRCQRLIRWRFVGGRGGRRLRWERDAEAVKEAELRDGKYWLVTTLDAPPEEILRIYCSRAAVERAFRITKESIRIRPMWSRKEEHILAHLFVCYLAYLLMALLEVEVRVEEPKLTAVRALQRFGRVTRRVGRRVDVSEDEALLERAFRDSG